MRKLKNYIIQKRVRATSLKAALKLEPTIPPSDIWEHRGEEESIDAIGFKEEPPEDDYAGEW
jgi:hypothetical protein